jgi:hypothetical protein
VFTASNIYKYMPDNFARCAGAFKDECKTCKRLESNAPFHPTTTRQTWIGPWVLEDACPSRVPMETPK